ncbi:protein kinase [Streptomyces sp. NPDC052236]|uniref:protein kinase n=1 Tax=Streptomyces sp. NPDC052236 TaxID=3365686 RepID=UPI0037D88537
MDDYAGRVLADRYRLPLPPSDAYELVETRAFDTYSGQEVLVRQVPLPEVVDAEVLDADGPAGAAVPRRAAQGRTTRRPTDPAVRRAIEAAQAAARIPDHARLDQVFDVFAEAGSLWIVSERVAARPLAALLAEKPLSPYRAAEVASDVLTALRVLHAHGWIHRNITVRTVLVCDDGRVVLTGLASGAAEEALCGYAPVPEEPGEPVELDEYPGHDQDDQDDQDELSHDELSEPGGGEPPGQAALEAGPYGTGIYGTESYETGPYGTGPYEAPAAAAHGALPSSGGVPDVRAARAGAIAAYRAGARAAARDSDDQRQDYEPNVVEGGPVQAGLDPDWWAHRPGDRERAPAASSIADDEYDDGESGDEEGDESGWYPGDDTSGPGRARLIGTWHDGPGPGPIPAGGSGGSTPYGVRPALPSARSGNVPSPQPGRPQLGVTGSSPYGSSPYGSRPALPGPRSAPPAIAAIAGSSSGGGWEHGGADAPRADAQRQAAVAGTGAPTGRWDEIVASGSTPAYRGPATPLAAERARQARIAVVGAVTERWAPEQAGPVHDNWQLAAPVGPATDLWALGALLYRAVQGHAPYPEESAVELVQLVCAEPPAFAEECGPLRPVVESLLRQDPTERPDFEELRGWLRSLVRSAPEPEAGMDVVALPSIAVDATRLPVIRRRGELVRRRRRGSAEVVHGRHRQQRGNRERRGERGPRSLGRVLLLLILALLVAAVAYAVLFLPKADPEGQTQPQGKSGPVPSATTDGPSPGRTAPDSPPASAGATGSPGAQEPQPQTSAPGEKLREGYVLRNDAEGFRTVVDKTWQRSPINDAGQVRYTDGDFTLIVVPGRDSVQANGSDPLAYQRDKERELKPFRESSWAWSGTVRRIDVGQRAMAEGEYTWQDSSGREVYVRNLALITGGSYHVVQVIGPEDQRERVTEAFQEATAAYQPTR